MVKTWDILHRYTILQLFLYSTKLIRTYLSYIINKEDLMIDLFIYTSEDIPRDRERN